MKYISSFGKKSDHLCSEHFTKKSATTTYSLKASLSSLLHQIVRPFWVQFYYFLVISIIGFLALKVSKPRTTDYIPDNFDLFFTSVSATTVASMSTVEMEVFSNAQLVIMTILIFLGGEIFFSLLELEFRCLNSSSLQNCKENSPSIVDDPQQAIELSVITLSPSSHQGHNSLTNNKSIFSDQFDGKLNHKSIKSLGFLVSGYLFIVHVLGSILVTMYIGLTPSANNVLKTKGISLQTFSIFTIVSTFANCGFIPTNENMIVFRQNPGLLLLLIPQGLLGGTLFPPCLRLVIWVLERFTKKKEYKYILNNYQDLGYGHLMSSKECWYLSGTVVVLIILQFVVYCIMEWSSGVMEEMNSYQKIVGSLFEVVNARHAGESVVDLSVVSSAVLVIFVFMMYLPPYTSFLPSGHAQQEEASKNNKGSTKQKNNIIETLLFSQISYLTIFVIVICMTERKSLKEDPLNFNVLNIVFEVISAYGSVGFSTGYSCKRRLKLDEICEDKWYGFSGRWSKGGKFTLILVMFFGRLKKFNLHGGKAWRIS